MKIIYCIPGLWNAGGMERVLCQKVNWIAEHTDWKVSIITTERVPQGHPICYFALNQRVEVVELGIDFDADYRAALPIKWWRHLKKQQRYKRQLGRLLRQQGTQAKEAGEEMICISLCGKEMEWIGRADLPCRTIAEIHFAMDYREQWLRQTHEGWLWQQIGRGMTRALIRQVRRVDGLVVLTRADAQTWRAAGVEHVEVVPNPCSIMPEQMGKHDKKQILAVGRLEAQKGFDWLIDAWGKIEKEFPEWILRICGEGSQRKELEKRIEEGGLRKRVVMDGLATDLEGEYQESGLFVLSSRYEGLPLALMEAMSCGLSCIAMDCKEGPRELIEQGRTGWLVRTGDVDALAASMTRALKDPAIRARTGQAAREYAMAHFGIDAVMETWRRTMNIQM